MEASEPGTIARADSGAPFVHWGAAVAGALATAALFFVLFTFGASIGLSVASTSPTWRNASFALWFLSGLYLMLSAIVCFAVGGYVAGRLRGRLGAAPVEEVEFRDGAHGLLVWAIAVLIGALLVAATTAGTASRVLPSASSANASSAEPLLAYQLDRLFRSDHRAGDTDLSYDRAEAGRILLTASGHSGVAADDRAYLVRLVAARTGLAGPDAERRVDDVIPRSREAISRARRSGVIVGFMTAAALLLGAAVSWRAASYGGRQRDGEIAATDDWWTLSFLGQRRR
jgi:hypothetical protein